MKVLVTGGSGFLGRHLLEALKTAGYSNLRIFNRNNCQDLKDIENFYGDLCNYEDVCRAVAGCDAVFHVAAKAGIWGTYNSYYKINVTGTQHVLQACLKHQVKYLIYTSSPSVVFNGESLANVDEQIPYGKRSKMCAYAHTKMLAEQLVLQANGQQNLKTVALRPHLIWGPGDNHLIPNILKAARKHRLFQVGHGDNWVDISYVTNVAQAHLLALEALKNVTCHVDGKAYFISQGDPVQLWPWINQLLSRLNLPKPIKKVPANVAFFVGALFELIYKIFCIRHQPPMTRFVAKELSQDHYFNISAAKMDLHYLPKVSNEEGMDILINDLIHQKK